jgi:hypothetical protein
MVLTSGKVHLPVHIGPPHSSLIDGRMIACCNEDPPPIDDARQFVGDPAGNGFRVVCIGQQILKVAGGVLDGTILRDPVQVERAIVWIERRQNARPHP